MHDVANRTRTLGPLPAAVREACEAATAVHGVAGPCAEDLAEALLTIVARRLAALGGTPTDRAVEAWVRALPVADLHLVEGVRKDEPGARARLEELHGTRAQVFAATRGVPEAEARRLVDDVLEEAAQGFTGPASLDAWVALRLIARTEPAEPPPGSVKFPEAGACPDDGLLGAALDPLLPRSAARLVAAHLELCATCRRRLLAVPTADGAPQVLPPRRRRRGWWGVVPGVVGAVLVAAVLLASVPWLLRLLPPSAARSSASEASVQLAAWAARLAGERPDLFADFRPLTLEELRLPADEVPRASLRLLRPRGVVLEARPDFVWEEDDFGVDYDVIVTTASGSRVAWIRRATGRQLAYPDGADSLVPGESYRWYVSPGDPSRRAGSAVRQFRVAPAAEARDFADAATVMGERLPDPLRKLGVAHLALRHGFDLEALHWAFEAHAAMPWDPLASATLARARAGR